jgi:hypothetical protein
MLVTTLFIQRQISLRQIIRYCKILFSDVGDGVDKSGNGLKHLENSNLFFHYSAKRTRNF